MDVQKELPILEEASLKLLRWALTLQDGQAFGFSRFEPNGLVSLGKECGTKVARHVGVAEKVIDLLLDPATPNKTLQKIKKGPFGLLMECLFQSRYGFKIEHFANESIAKATGIPLPTLVLLDQYRKAVTERFVFNNIAFRAGPIGEDKIV